jgi:diphosphomevalonate decarboxylase
MKASAKANSNIALTKYWGKRDKELMLPNNGSISMTLSDLFTKTTVEFDGKYAEDEFWINGEKNTTKEASEVSAFLGIVREKAGTDSKAKVMTENNFPTAAGLASSASGYAALALAASKAAGLSLDAKELSMLARRGSGSAARSIHGGFVEWKKGEKDDGSDCYAEQVAPPGHWPEFRMLTTIVSSARKKVKSRAGMAQTVATSPMYRAWLETVEPDIEAVRQGITGKDFEKVGSVSEANTIKMHATMITTKPPIIYWQPATMAVIHAVLAWRDEGIKCYFTIDAGPQMKVMCLEKDAAMLREGIMKIEGVEKVIECRCGGPAELLEEHLF